MDLKLTKKDCLVIFFCAGFGLMSLGAIGGGSRKRAKDIVCRSNLRQWYLAMIDFTEDNNGNLWRGYSWFPCPSAPPESQHDWWIGALHDYHGNIDKIRSCPTAAKTRYQEDGNVPGPGWGKEPFAAWGFSPWIKNFSQCEDCDSGSYGANGWIENTWDECGVNAPKWWRNINAIANAETVPFLLDAQWLDGWPEPTNFPPQTENENWRNGGSQIVRFVQNRHEEAENCAFMDGTVRKVGLKELWTLKWHRYYNTSGPYTLAGGASPGNWPLWMRDMEDY